jgi:tetratricopeptide (TPR) repeat protein
MPATSKRLEFMQKATASGSQDPLAWYGLAMEYRALERHDEALASFETLRDKHPDYVAAYLMCGQMLEKIGRVADAKAWLATGLEAARKKGDAHAASELESALASLG